jgi:hypothetical protein
MNPWDRPPSPTEADRDADILYAAVGRALSSWENIESELSHWYALLIGKMWQHAAYDEYYDKGRSGQARIAVLEAAAERYFVKNPHQEVEAKFRTLMEATTAYADRRHEVAHGIVRPVQLYWPWVEATMKAPMGHDHEYCLVPPHYQRNWFDPQKWNPEFVYTSKEIHMIDGGFVDHLHLLIDFRNDHLPEVPARA